MAGRAVLSGRSATRRVECKGGKKRERREDRKQEMPCRVHSHPSRQLAGTPYAGQE